MGRRERESFDLAFSIGEACSCSWALRTRSLVSSRRPASTPEKASLSRLIRQLMELEISKPTSDNSSRLTAANAATVPVFLVSQMTSEGLFLAKLSAASVLASLPVVIAGWLAQKQLVRGLSMGAVK